MITPGGNPYVERCISVDPGKLTGMCVMERRKDGLGHTVEILESAETSPMYTIPVFRKWYEQYSVSPALSCGPPMRVVMESFKITVRTGELSQEAAWALETIGAIKQACRDFAYNEEAIKFFRPDQKSVFPNPKLKKLGLWHTGGKGHALDAIRHGSLYLSQTGQFPESS